MQDLLPVSEFRTLTAVCRAFLPETDSAWLASVPTRAARVLGQLPNRGDVDQLRMLLRLLEVAPSNLALFGATRGFSAMDRQAQQATLRTMAAHPLGLIRTGFHALKLLSATLYYADADESGSNPTWSSLGYPGPLIPAPDTPKTIRPLRVETTTDLHCDVVIVGSGAGGGVMAGELAAAGWDVIVMERGGYSNEADFHQLEWEALQKRYLYGGLLSTADQGVGILAGAGLGGGTVVNYTTSFRTPDRVREEWARDSGLDFFTSEGFTRSLDAVCQRLHVNQDHNRPAIREELMARGLTALGWHVDRMPRNVDGCTQDDLCGYCGFGCVRGAKQSTLKTYLQDAFDHGARFLVGCGAERVLTEGGRAVGIAARTGDGHPLTVRARTVVISAGAIETPALLLRSGWRRPAGDHLHLHPVTAVWGRFGEAVRPWTGTIQALYSDQFADLDENYGCKFETTGIHPLFLGFAQAWSGAEQFDQAMRQLPHLSVIGILMRDRGAGRVAINRDGAPVVHYQVSGYDRRHFRHGVEGAARVFQAAGAREISSSQNRPVVFDPRAPGSLEKWMSSVDQVGYGPNQTTYFSWHQMGSCRMGRSPDTSVVNGRGETHAVQGVYIADASLFPSASGVNPMITIAALAHSIAQPLAAASPSRSA